MYDSLCDNVWQIKWICSTESYMAENGVKTKSRSIRVGDDVWEAIQALPGKTDDALRAVLIQKIADDPIAPLLKPLHGDVNRWFRETWKRLEDLPGEILAAADAKRARKATSSVIPSTLPSPESDLEMGRPARTASAS